jgi:hypothetical protein
MTTERIRPVVRLGLCRRRAPYAPVLAGLEPFLGKDLSLQVFGLVIYTGLGARLRLRAPGSRRAYGPRL